jgi:hypothetical protein
MQSLARILPAAASLAGGLVLLSGVALAKEGKSIDCGDLDVKLDLPGFISTCTDYSDRSVMSNSGGARVEALSAKSEEHEQILVVVDMRALGAIFLKRRGFEEDIRDSFTGESLTDWQTTDEVAGYELAQYTGRDLDEHCIAFRRNLYRRDAGFGRKLVGIGCTTQDRAALIETLKKLSAPGD